MGHRAFSGNRAADRAHGVGDDEHRSALHAAVVEASQVSLHFRRIAPVVGRARVFVMLGTDECSIFDACDIGRVGTHEERVGAQVGVQPARRSGLGHGLGELVVLLFSAVAPPDLSWSAEVDDLVDPGLKFWIRGGRSLQRRRVAHRFLPFVSRSGLRAHGARSGHRFGDFQYIKKTGALIRTSGRDSPARNGLPLPSSRSVDGDAGTGTPERNRPRSDAAPREWLHPRPTRR